jgi:Cd2+/Zn2+-exporting ATPase
MYSEHPLARAIIEKAGANKDNSFIIPEESDMIQGQGLKDRLEGSTILVGNRKLMEEHGIAVSEAVERYLRDEEAEGQTAVLVGNQYNILGVISIADTIRKDADKLVKRLKALGIKRIVMLTGDNQRAAAAIAKKVGLDDYFAELLPEDKVSILKKLQEEFGATAMVGDGINDAPALASADLGIAIGGVGSDVAMETADVVLMSDEIRKLSFAIGLSRATVKNMKQNIYFAIIVVGMLLTGVLAKAVFLSFGMLVHELSVLIVIINAIRLLNYREK